LTAIAGFGLLFPANALPYGTWVDVAGLVLGVAIVGWELIARRNGAAAEAEAPASAAIDDAAVAAGPPPD
jgi:hypothetical protein